ncbi:hypothetical protein E2C01_050781 [Portunus trituberculatus]|uniref:Uncharacterized protein n=1 Tax=Portunus trituberculatus TaxID=210409 RepID=A0A5B7GH95_PORTR|nr:hypothetical protein [Portunus trituberculatus]
MKQLQLTSTITLSSLLFTTQPSGTRNTTTLMVMVCYGFPSTPVVTCPLPHLSASPLPLLRLLTLAADGKIPLVFSGFPIIVWEREAEKIMKWCLGLEGLRRWRKRGKGRRWMRRKKLGKMRKRMKRCGDSSNS